MAEPVRIYKPKTCGQPVSCTARNQSKLGDIIGLLREQLGGCMERGFYGEFMLTVSLKDGTVLHTETDVKQRHK